MNSPFDDYKSMKNIDGIWDTAYFTLFEKYLKYKLRGSDKLIEIDSTDQESIIWSKNGGYPIAGSIYTFIYPIKQEPIPNPPKKAKSYIDFAPLVFCMGSQNNIMTGLNFNMLPAGDRLKFLESFYSIYKNFLEREVDLLSQNNKLALNKKFMSYIASGKGQTLINAFNRKNSANYNFAYRKYDLKKVKMFRMIEYGEWKYIPFYDPKDAFRKLNQIEMYKLYGKSK